MQWFCPSENVRLWHMETRFSLSASCGVRRIGNMPWFGFSRAVWPGADGLFFWNCYVLCTICTQYLPHRASMSDNGDNVRDVQCFADLPNKQQILVQTHCFWSEYFCFSAVTFRTSLWIVQNLALFCSHCLVCWWKSMIPTVIIPPSSQDLIQNGWVVSGMNCSLEE